MKAKIRKTGLKRKNIILIGVSLCLVVSVSFFYLNKSDSDSSIIPSSTTDQVQNKPTDTNKPENLDQAQTENSQKQTSAPTQTNVELVAPYGSFVSNHRPNLSNLSKMQSICNTTPGAKCSITFKRGSDTKSLAEQTVGSDGTTTWEWDTISAGLSVGTWEITATATSGGKTLSTKDTINLEVSQ